jgi:tRNA dimethylallyltransferase
MDKSKILIITGPTASGKSSLAWEVIRHFTGEIISADSLQVYRYMDIGTAKPTIEERNVVRYHLIDILYPDEEFSAALFCEEAKRVISHLKEREKRALVVGGTGLYIKALTSGLIKGGEVDDSIKDRLRLEAQEEGGEQLYRLLRKLDPITADQLHPHDTFRIIRALEVVERTGQPISFYRQRHYFQEEPYHVLKIGLNMGRDELYRRIDRRVDEMMERGFKEEVQRLLEMGYKPFLKPMKALGYKQLVEYLFGQCDLFTAIERIKRDTRRYAKRQITWFKADSQIQWVKYPKDKDAIFKMIDGFWHN